LCRLNLETGAVTDLLNDPEGGVRDPRFITMAKKSCSRTEGRDETYHLYEIDTGGSGLKQLTDGPYDDIEPTWLPDGDIAFCSTRCNRWVMCWMVRWPSCTGAGLMARMSAAQQ